MVAHKYAAFSRCTYNIYRSRLVLLVKVVLNHIVVRIKMLPQKLQNGYDCSQNVVDRRSSMCYNSVTKELRPFRRKIIREGGSVLAGIPQNLKRYLDKLFAELHKTLNGKAFSCSLGYVNECYSRFVHFATKQGEYLFFLCCCQDPESNPAHLFFGSYVIDSLADELMRVLFERGGDFLVQSNKPLFNGVLPEHAGVLLRRLAAQYLEDDIRNGYGIPFDVIDCLSQMNYEQEQAKGDLIFMPIMTNNLKSQCIWSVSTQDQIGFSMRCLRTIRKHLAGATPDEPQDISSALLFAKKDKLPVFCGTVSLKDGLPIFKSKLDYVHVKITGPLRWKLLLQGKFVCFRDSAGLCFPDGLDHIESEKMDNIRIQDALLKAFSQEDSSKAVKENLSCLINIVQAVRKQHHGAALIIADWENQTKCRETLGRLKRHKKVLPVDFSATEDPSTAITCAAKMDGAILADIRSGQVIALAAILDGKSCIKGDPSRGSRYNSIANATRLLRCSATHSEVVSFVFSSDGGMDILS